MVVVEAVVGLLGAVVVEVHPEAEVVLLGLVVAISSDLAARGSTNALTPIYWQAPKDPDGPQGQ